MVNKRGVNFYLGGPNCGLIVSRVRQNRAHHPAMIAVAIFPHQHTLGLGEGGMDAGFDSLSEKRIMNWAADLSHYLRQIGL
jgi:hypothetical protein